jgi:GT2 family glycosyltransferase
MAEDLTVLIANLGQMTNLRPCLQSLFASLSGATSIRVIVGFNFAGESDGPSLLASEFSEVEQLRAPMKLGYCRAYNQLMARSTGRYVLLLDDDTVLPAGTIDGMVRFMDAHPEVGIAGCRTMSPDGSYQKATARMFSLRTELANVVRPAAFWHDGIDESTSRWTRACWLNGHFLLVRAEAIRQVGGLDEHFYTFQCEADWCLRMHRAGWTIAYVPEYQVMHVGGQHSSAPGVKSFSILMRSYSNRYYFIRKHYGDRAVHLMRPIMSLAALLRLLHYIFVWVAIPARRAEAAPKLAANLRVILMGLAARPEDLPEDLQRESATIGVFQPGLPG